MSFFLVALSLNAVESVTLRRRLTKLMPSTMFTDGSSDKEGLEEFNVWPMQITVKQILETAKAAPKDNPAS
jgi:hypothetical protein